MKRTGSWWSTYYWEAICDITYSRTFTSVKSLYVSFYAKLLLLWITSNHSTFFIGTFQIYWFVFSQVTIFRSNIEWATYWLYRNILNMLVQMFTLFRFRLEIDSFKSSQIYLLFSHKLFYLHWIENWLSYQVNTSIEYRSSTLGNV